MGQIFQPKALSTQSHLTTYCASGHYAYNWQGYLQGGVSAREGKIRVNHCIAPQNPPAGTDTIRTSRATPFLPHAVQGLKKKEISNRVIASGNQSESSLLDLYAFIYLIICL